MSIKKEIICIECPNGCELSVEIDNDKVISVTGNKCDKGNAYAVCEVENPMRILTSTVRAEGLNVKMVPVKTSKPISKELLGKAMEEIHKIMLNKPVSTNEIIIESFLNTQADLISTRKVS